MNDTAAIPRTPASSQEIDALVIKYRPEIDRIKWMESKEQMQAFADLGVDPKALEEHYKGLRERADRLREQDRATIPKTDVMGWTSFAGDAAAAFAVTRKLTNAIARWTIVTLAAVGSGFAGAFAGSRLFRNGIREQSKLLNIEAKDAFERELAVALENKSHEIAPAPAVPVSVTVTADIAPRDPSYAAQATSDKAAAQAARNQRS